MKRILLFFAVAVFAAKLSASEGTNAPAPPKIGTADADKYYDQTMIVTGKVAQVTVRPTVTFLNLDKAYPDSPFSVVIFHGHSSFYGDANALKGKSIEIKGKIVKYHEKPEIALDNTNQLNVIGGWVPSIKAPASAPPVNPAPATQATNAPPAASATNFPDVM